MASYKIATETSTEMFFAVDAATYLDMVEILLAAKLRTSMSSLVMAPTKWFRISLTMAAAVLVVETLALTKTRVGLPSEYWCSV